MDKLAMLSLQLQKRLQNEADLLQAGDLIKSNPLFRSDFLREQEFVRKQLDRLSAAKEQVLVAAARGFQSESQKVQDAKRRLGEQVEVPASRIRRSAEFWARAVHVYGGYKVCQLRVRLLARSEEESSRLWEQEHELAAEKLYRLCIDLRGFFLKAGQFLAKPDLSPAAWVRRLSSLHDAAPADDISVVHQIIQDQLGLPPALLFDSFSEKPLGSASIAQVHRARLKGSGLDVAVKVQHPNCEPLMMTDLANLRTFATLLQKFELPFDVLTGITELENQIKYEFDFHHEAESMDLIAASLARAGGSRKSSRRQEKGDSKLKGDSKVAKSRLSSRTHSGSSPVIVPRSIPDLVSRRVLVMEYIEGTPILQLPEEMRKRGINPNGRLAHAAKLKIVQDLAAAYGHMILRDGHFQADPHPGNILVCKGPKVGLLDFGQTKQIPNELRRSLAKLVLAMKADDVIKIGDAFKEIGIETSKNAHEEPYSFRRMATLMFDTKWVEGISTSNPFSSESSLKTNAVNKLPSDIFFIVRTMQLLRGLTSGMGLKVSVAEQWSSIAKEVLQNEEK